MWILLLFIDIKTKHREACAVKSWNWTFLSFFCVWTLVKYKTQQRIFKEKHKELYGVKIFCEKQAEHQAKQFCVRKILRQCCKLDFPRKKPSLQMKSHMGTFHEVLPGNSVFFHFYYTDTIVTEYLDQTTALYGKNYISTENFTFGIQNLS